MAQPKSWQQTLQELWELLKDYARQETIGPLKSLGTRLAKGFAGSVLVSFGYFLVVLGVMRFLQRHYDKTMDHNWIPYLVAVLMLGCMMFVAYKKMTNSSEKLSTAEASTIATTENGDRS